MMERQRSAGVSFSVWAMFQPEAQRLRWLSGTILGRDVVPEVCSTSATSSAPASPCAAGAGTRLPAQREAACAALRLRRQRNDLDAELFGDLDGRRRAVLFDDQELRAEVGEVKLELIGLIIRVQWRAGRMACHAKKGGGHLGAIRKHDGNPVLLARAEARQCGARFAGQTRATP